MPLGQPCARGWAYRNSHQSGPRKLRARSFDRCCILNEGEAHHNFELDCNCRDRNHSALDLFALDLLQHSAGNVFLVPAGVHQDALGARFKAS